MVAGYSVFDARIEPGDIKQGGLGDCWFLCALASLAEFPDLVTVSSKNHFIVSCLNFVICKKLFYIESKSVSGAGVYKVRFCKNGQWQTVTVDDQFPCIEGNGPAFSRSHGNKELWVFYHILNS